MVTTDSVVVVVTYKDTSVQSCVPLVVFSSLDRVTQVFSHQPDGLGEPITSHSWVDGCRDYCKITYRGPSTTSILHPQMSIGVLLVSGNVIPTSRVTLVSLHEVCQRCTWGVSSTKTGNDCPVVSRTLDTDFSLFTGVFCSSTLSLCTH